MYNNIIWYILFISNAAAGDRTRLADTRLMRFDADQRRDTHVRRNRFPSTAVAINRFIPGNLLYYVTIHNIYIYMHVTMILYIVQTKPYIDPLWQSIRSSDKRTPDTLRYQSCSSSVYYIKYTYYIYWFLVPTTILFFLYKLNRICNENKTKYSGNLYNEKKKIITILVTNRSIQTELIVSVRKSNSNFIIFEHDPNA